MRAVLVSLWFASIFACTACERPPASGNGDTGAPSSANPPRSTAANQAPRALAPSVRRFVDNLDVRCYQLSGQPPLNRDLTLSQLNPVVLNVVGPQRVTLGEPQQLCVPVAKDQALPPDDVLPYISYVDWKCYAIKGPEAKISLDLTQLNPVMAKLVGANVQVKMLAPQQLCVPVFKDTAKPPPQVEQLVKYLDEECYAVQSDQRVNGKALSLHHLNPLFGAPGWEKAALAGGPSQLCVPVAKDGTIPPDDVLQYVQFSDVLCYPLSGASLDRQLALTQLDPVMIAKQVPVEHVAAGASKSLCVPVAKDGKIPPGTP